MKQQNTLTHRQTHRQAAPPRNSHADHLSDFSEVQRNGVGHDHQPQHHLAHLAHTHTHNPVVQ